MKKSVNWSLLLMRKSILILSFALFLLGAPSSIKANPEYRKVAMDLLEAITSGEFQKATENFDEKMSNGLSHQHLQILWGQLQMQLGKFAAISDYSESRIVDVGTVFINHLVFEKDSLKTLVTVGQNSETNKIEISGFLIQPIEVQLNSKEYVDAGYVDKSKFEEIEIVLPPDSILEGRLTIPKNLSKNQKVPAVVLVHGSAPHDFDETILENKPFRDIAFGLSGNGIAVLRYNKRTLVDKNLDVSTLTINEESVFDAVEAVNFLKKNYSDKIENIYVLGHSQGGFVLPRIANLSKNASGFISLAGNSRPFSESLIDQYEYLWELDKQAAETQEAKDYIDNLKIVELEKVKRLQKNDFDENTPADLLPLGIPPRYYMDIADYNPGKEFSNENRPILFLQGARDYQVTLKDFELWKKELGERPNTTFMLFDDLNHLLQTGVGKSKPAEYEVKQNVDKQVIDAIVNWLNEVQRFNQ
jgi:fermentation-respiration switch protein FrsA (DUF1100 family)